MTEQAKSPVVEAWEKYQSEAARDPYSAGTKRALALYKRRLNAAAKARQS